jgi:hypothetical protein
MRAIVLVLTLIGTACGVEDGQRQSADSPATESTEDASEGLAIRSRGAKPKPAPQPPKPQPPIPQPPAPPPAPTPTAEQQAFTIMVTFTNPFSVTEQLYLDGWVGGDLIAPRVMDAARPDMPGRGILHSDSQALFSIRLGTKTHAGNFKNGSYVLKVENGLVVGATITLKAAIAPSFYASLKTTQIGVQLVSEEESAQAGVMNKRYVAGQTQKMINPTAKSQAFKFAITREYEEISEKQ